MRLSQEDRLLDYPLIAIRDFLRRNRVVPFETSAIQAALGCSARAARRVAAAMEQAGYVQRSITHIDHWRWHWRITDQGLRLANATAARPITRATAERRLIELLERVDQVNAGSYACRVARVRVFGSYLTQAPNLGDIDLCVDLLPRRSDPDAQQALVRRRVQVARRAGRTFSSYPEELAWGEEEVNRFLRGASRVFSFVSHDDPVLSMTATRTLFEAPDAPPPQVSPRGDQKGPPQALTHTQRERLAAALAAMQGWLAPGVPFPRPLALTFLAQAANTNATDLLDAWLAEAVAANSGTLTADSLTLSSGVTPLREYQGAWTEFERWIDSSVAMVFESEAVGSPTSSLVADALLPHLTIPEHQPGDPLYLLEWMVLLVRAAGRWSLLDHLVDQCAALLDAAHFDDTVHAGVRWDGGAIDAFAHIARTFADAALLTDDREQQQRYRTLARQAYSELYMPDHPARRSVDASLWLVEQAVSVGLTDTALAAVSDALVPITRESHHDLRSDMRYAVLLRWLALAGNAAFRGDASALERALLGAGVSRSAVAQNNPDDAVLPELFGVLSLLRGDQVAALHTLIDGFGAAEAMLQRYHDHAFTDRTLIRIAHRVLDVGWRNTPDAAPLLHLAWMLAEEQLGSTHRWTTDFADAYAGLVGHAPSRLDNWDAPENGESPA